MTYFLRHWLIRDNRENIPIPLWFDSHIASTVYGSFFCQRSPVAPGEWPRGVPVLGYLELTEIQHQRKLSLQPKPPRRAKWAPNMPVWRLFQKRLLSVTPRPSEHDPYIVAVLIAMAQAQRLAASMEHVSYPVSVYSGVHLSL